MSKQLTQEQIDLLNKPLPAEALKQHPTRKGLSTIKAIYVTERLNDVFGIGAWRVRTDFVDSYELTAKNGSKSTMVVTKTIFDIPEYGIYYECYGGNDNADIGDAFKGSTTDAITKIASYLGIGAHVWKNEKVTEEPQPKPSAPQFSKEHIAEVKHFIDNCESKDDLKALKERFPDEFAKCQEIRNYSVAKYDSLTL